MKVSVGDKFVLEVAEILEGMSQSKLYRMKGFNALVFDEIGIEKLTKLQDVWPTNYEPALHDEVEARYAGESKVYRGHYIAKTDTGQHVVMVYLSDDDTGMMHLFDEVRKIYSE